MLASTSNNRSQVKRLALPVKSEAGFSLVEMVVAMLLMLVGLLALASAIGYAFMASNRGRNITNTKLLVVSMLEQMETLRNTQQLTFGQISNAGSVDNTGAQQNFNGFPTTFQPVSSDPGPDAIFGTCDDLATNPGGDGTYCTSDDVLDQTKAVPGYSRQVIITSLNQDLKRVQVTLRYPGGSGEVQSMVGVSYLNDDSRSNFRP